MQIPDAIYLLMQNTHLVTCDLSNNVISKLPVKFAERFPTVTGECKTRPVPTRDPMCFNGRVGVVERSIRRNVTWIRFTAFGDCRAK